ncbi:DNA-binding HxlR family transcriptional regulator [Arthrobacter stackebrandtii]|uniref:DNA-binding HxlR family transcriptional regulator n=1 Tax=Arthrobacter stackebrandtii TaxID=272161 RepID=A0ABS4Z173_9MICC|nr:helix-turn-helix domain-containing protein [Arthrobacter stackebrandtii]MBP2414797.1 DNA-binding HxlR family transcriptional regulator [Arthrobacter stackebrandtii]PYG99456.1 transcriptional regulator [Arthrobacter stackebrandtii]
MEVTATKPGSPGETPAEVMTISMAHRELLDQVLDKWSLQVLAELCTAPQRFNELRRAIPAVSQKSLTNTLRRLERNGVVERLVISSRPVAVEYRITPLGKTMRDPIDRLLEWAAQHMMDIERARDRFEGLDPGR